MVARSYHVFHMSAVIVQSCSSKWHEDCMQASKKILNVAKKHVCLVITIVRSFQLSSVTAHAFRQQLKAKFQ